MATPAPSWQDLYDLGKAEAQAENTALTFDEGDISDQLVSGAAAMADHIIGWAASRFKATYLDGASGDDLTILADDHWNIQRRTAVQAVVPVQITRSSGSGGAGTIFAGTVVGTTPDVFGKQVRFLLDADVNWLDHEVGTKVVNATAEIAGADGNVLPSSLVNFVGTLFDGSPSLFSVTNSARAAGGDDEEDDDSLRERVRQLPATLRHGTLDALEYGAKQVPTVKVATAVQDDSTGIVTVYVADADGNSNGAMTDAVTAELVKWKCAGEDVIAAGGALLTQNVILTLAVRVGVNAGALVTQVRAAIIARGRKLRAGETLTRTMLRTAAMNVDVDGIAEVTISTPAADVVPAGNQILRIGTVTVS